MQAIEAGLCVDRQVNDHLGEAKQDIVMAKKRPQHNAVT